MLHQPASNAPSQVAMNRPTDSTQSPKFRTGNDFQRELRRPVDAFFIDTGRKPRDCAAMYLKSVLLLTTFAASYALLQSQTHLRAAWFT